MEKSCDSVLVLVDVEPVLVVSGFTSDGGLTIMTMHHPSNNNIADVIMIYYFKGFAPY